MAFRQIYNMYEVTNTSSIRSIVIITKNTQFLAHANSRLRDIRHQVVWNAIRILTYQTTLVSVNRIEITKQHHIPLRIRLLHVHQHLLHLLKEYSYFKLYLIWQEVSNLAFRLPVLPEYHMSLFEC